MKQPEGEGLHLPTLIFGTVNGAIGVVASLPQPLYTSLLKIQENLTRVIKGIGGFSHEQCVSCLIFLLLSTKLLLLSLSFQVEIF